MREEEKGEDDAAPGSLPSSARRAQGPSGRTASAAGALGAQGRRPPLTQTGRTRPVPSRLSLVTTTRLW